MVIRLRSPGRRAQAVGDAEDQDPRRNIFSEPCLAGGMIGSDANDSSQGMPSTLFRKALFSKGNPSTPRRGGRGVQSCPRGDRRALASELRKYSVTNSFYNIEILCSTSVPLRGTLPRIRGTLTARLYSLFLSGSADDVPRKSLKPMTYAIDAIAPFVGICSAGRRSKPRKADSVQVLGEFLTT